jgi:outer membrane protein assembly factor BamB
VVFPSPDGRLYGLDAHDGSVRWRADIGVPGGPVARQHSTPAIANGVVWIVTTGGGKAQLKAFDARSGRELWHSARFKDVPELAHVPSPVVAGGYVLVGTNGGRVLAYHSRSR